MEKIFKKLKEIMESEVIIKWPLYFIQKLVKIPSTFL